MGHYRIRVATGAWLFSGSHNRVQLWLVGVLGEAELELQLRPTRGQVRRGSGNPDPGRGWAHGGRVARRRVTARPCWLGLQELEHLGGERVKARARGGGRGLSPFLLPPTVGLAASTPSPIDPRPLLWDQ